MEIHSRIGLRDRLARTRRRGACSRASGWPDTWVRRAGTVQNLEIVRVDEARNTLLVKGFGPGAQRWAHRRSSGRQDPLENGKEGEMQVDVISGAEGSGSVVLADRTFAADYNQALVHQVVSAYLAGRRRGTKSRKSRAEVRGGGTKPWRQKGLGRARAGSIRSPIWRGGGAAFAAKPRNFEQKVNRKMYRGAMRCILSELVRTERLVVVGDLTLKRPKTRDLAVRLSALKLEDVLIVTVEHDDNLSLASRNLPRVEIQTCADVSPVSLLAFGTVAMTVAAARRLEERFE